MMHEEVEFRYCPVCGGTLHSRTLKPEEPDRLVCSKCDFVFYLDPKVVACSIVEMDGRIVLLKRAIDPQKGKWVLPGGYVDRGEEVKAAALRETEEECGLKIRTKELLGLYSYPGRILGRRGLCRRTVRRRSSSWAMRPRKWGSIRRKASHGMSLLFRAPSTL